MEQPKKRKKHIICAFCIKEEKSDYKVRTL